MKRSRLLAAALVYSVFAVDGRAGAEQCLEEAFGRPLACTATDVSVATVEVVNVVDPCSFAGDTATLDVVLHVQANAASRYDLGFFIGTDALNSTDADCTVAALPPDMSSLDGDACGDIAGTAELLVPVTGVTMLCIDRDDDLFFDLSTCATWRSVSDNADCPDAGHALPGNLSKCHCQNIRTALGDTLCETNVDCSYEENICTDNVCDPASPAADELGCTFIPRNSGSCDDGLLCTTGDACLEGECTGSPVACDDGQWCSVDRCNEDNGACESSSCDPAADSLVCRSPLFWAHRSGYEANGNGNRTATNVVQSLLDASGALEVCGKSLHATSHAGEPFLTGLGLDSVLEAMCVRTQGSDLRELYRLLVAAALDCAASGLSEADCDDALQRRVGVTWTACSERCARLAAGGSRRAAPSTSRCIDALGQLAEDACARRELCHDAIGFCPGSAPPTSIKACAEARQNACTIDSCP